MLRPDLRPRVLIVDDVEANRRLLRAQLSAIECEVLEAEDGALALASVSEGVDLVLLDIQMPGMNGFEACRRLKSAPETRLIPVVMVTALGQVDDRVRALDVGADDFLTKPVERVELQARVRSLLRLKAVYDRLDDSDRVIYALARAVEAKDSYTEAHTLRVAAGALGLGEILGIGQEELDQLQRGALVHDLGKIGIPDGILHKPERLSDEELRVMRQHPLIGEEIARPLHSAAGFLSVIRHHHEWVDGSGYPDGLAGTTIPLLARIVAVSDAYDALVSDRPYRPRRTPEEAIGVLQDGAGIQWDSRLVEAFVERVLPSGRLDVQVG
ncbi:MAG: HD domain-containing phosphohydrolase [Candidatus Dormibacteraceae bacterium]